MGKTVTLTINGQKITADNDQTILQVCREQKLDNIPTLCKDEMLPPFGSCFLCVVEVEGQAKMFPSCSTKVAEGMAIQTRSEKVRRARKTCLELLLSDHYADCFGPCRLHCPADVDIQGYMSLIHIGKFKDAVALIKEKNPLPSVCGRVCTRKCELNCRRALVDDAVGIDFLKRYAADLDMSGEMWTPATKPDNGNRVAIIGSGPSGLSCAYYLALEGYRPAIFEALPHPGGMLRYGIPEYRLPKAVLDKEIEWILGLGVTLETNKSLGKDFTLDGLFEQGFKSVYIALGAQIGKPMQVENETAEGVLSGVDFLRNVQMQTAPEIKGRVVVVGGGNTALDAARSALRKGADEVILLYRRTRKEMPANPLEVVAAEEEGIKMEFLAAPVRVNLNGNRMESISCIRMELGEPDASGRRRPVEVKDSEFTIPCNWVISAIGQEADLGGVSGIAVTKRKTIEANQGTFDTARPGVFSGGDVVTGPADAIDAIAAGRLAARSIAKFVETGVVEPLVKRFESKRDYFHPITAGDLPPVQLAPRHSACELPVLQRIKSFDEVEKAYDPKTAFEESARCAECGCEVGLSCELQDYCTEYGVDQSRFIGAYNKYKVDTRHPFIKIDSNKCIRCGRCVMTCEEILNVAALGFVNRGFRTIIKPALDKALQDTNCVSCGNCIDVCPTGALIEKLPFGRSGPWQMNNIFSTCSFCAYGCSLTIKAKSSDLFFISGASPELGPNHGELCARGRFGYQLYLDSKRATTPMVRKNGQLVEATWDEAFAAVEEGLRRVREDVAPDEILVSASPKMSDEQLYLTSRFARAALGTSNMVSFHHLASGADYHALDEMLGATVSTVGAEELEQADLYLFLGGDPTSDTPVPGWQMKRRIRHGIPSIVINSRDIDLTAHATISADPRRGTATRLLNGIIAELLRRGQIDEEFIKARTVNFEALRGKLINLELGEISSITGVTEERIREIADLLSDRSKKIVAWYNLDSRIDRASDDLLALTTLLLLLGKIGVPGSGLALFSEQCNHNGMLLAGFDAQLLPGGAQTTDGKHAAHVAELWHTDVKNLAGKTASSIDNELCENKIRAAFVIGENPAALDRYNAPMNHLEFLVVGDLFLSETARAADVFLPVASNFESEGRLTNWCGVSRELRAIGKPLNGMATIEILKTLLRLAGHPVGAVTVEDLASELDQLKRDAGSEGRLKDRFLQPDGKAHFKLYSDRVVTFNALKRSVLTTARDQVLPSATAAAALSKSL
jgi:formate dehydrogenase major subunit